MGHVSAIVVLVFLQLSSLLISYFSWHVALWVPVSLYERTNQTALVQNLCRPGAATSAMRSMAIVASIIYVIAFLGLQIWACYLFQRYRLNNHYFVVAVSSWFVFLFFNTGLFYILSEEYYRVCLKHDVYQTVLLACALGVCMALTELIFFTLAIVGGGDDDDKEGADYARKHE